MSERLNQVTTGENQHATFSPEWLATRMTIEAAVELNAQPILDRLNMALGIHLQPRSEHFHMTIIGAGEKDIIPTLTPDQLTLLQQVGDELRRGEGVTMTGIGFIDGATAPNMRDVDKSKKVAFIAVDAPAVNNFRRAIGLQNRDLHVTLGFEGGDIHMMITGQDTSGKKPKAILGFVPKKADPSFDMYTKDVDLTFGDIDGQAR